MTIDLNDLVLASLPASHYLYFLSLHTYPEVDETFPLFLANQLAAYSARHGRPTLLGKFGWSSAQVPDELVARLEGGTLTEPRQRGLAGAFKWMLNDVEGGEEGREGRYGLFDSRGKRKSGAHVWREAAQLGS